MLQHLNVGTVQRPDGQRTVKSKFHITGTGGFGPGQRNLFRKVGGRNNHLRQADAVVGDKHHFQLVANLRIVVDHFGDVVDQVNDVFRHVISRSRFTGEDIHTRYPLSVRIGLNAIVAGDHMQHVHQLAFVFVNTLDLHIKQRFRVHHHVQLLGNERGQTLFVPQLRAAHRLIYQWVIAVLFKLTELAEIGSPGAANVLIQHFRERRVGQRQPATRRHAVGDVAEASRENLRKISKQRLHHQVGVQLGNAVNLVAHHHRQPCHTHTTAVRFIDNRRPPQQSGIVRILFLQRLQEVVVDFKDDLQMARQNFAQHIDRPGLQRFAHQGVVGIREDLAADLKRIVPAELMLIDQQTH